MDSMEKSSWRTKAEKLWEQILVWFWILVIIAGFVWVAGAVTRTVKQWLKPDQVDVEKYAPPKPARPTGFVFLASVGDEGSETQWYLRADTVLGPRQKRLFWISLNFEKNKKPQNKRSEYLYAINCETTEYRSLKWASYKTDSTDAYDVGVVAYDKAEADYPVPNTGVMAAYKEVCKSVYDPIPEAKQSSTG